MKNTLCILLISTFALSLQAQKARTSYGEYGVGLGTWNMTSQIANQNSVGAVFKEVRPHLNVFAKYHFNDWFGFGVDMNYGAVYASDANHQEVERGFEVSTSLFNSNLFVEAHLIRFGKYHRDRKFSLYVKGGAGLSAWDPELNLDERQRNNIEIENGAYSAFSYSYGMGAKFRIAYRSILTVEGRLHNSGGNTLEGFTLVNPDGPVSNDTFWGLTVAYSYAIF